MITEKELDRYTYILKYHFIRDEEVSEFNKNYISRIKNEISQNFDESIFKKDLLIVCDKILGINSEGKKLSERFQREILNNNFYGRVN